MTPTPALPSSERLNAIAEMHENLAALDTPASAIERDIAAACRALIAAREWCRAWNAHEGVMPHELCAIVAGERAP